MKAQELAARRDCHENTVYRMAHEHGCPAYQIAPAGELFFNLEQVEAWDEGEDVEAAGIPPGERLVRPSEIAEWLGVSLNTIYRWINRGLPHEQRHPGGEIAIDTGEALGFLRGSVVESGWKSR